MLKKYNSLSRWLYGREQRGKPILNTIKSILSILLGKNKLLLAIFIHRYREKEAALRSMTVHQSAKVVVF